MLIVLVSFVIYTVTNFTGGGIGGETAAIYCMLLALYALLNDIKNTLKNK